MRKVAVAAAAAGSSLYIVADDDARRQAQAATRIARLVSTVAVMTSSYSLQMAKEKIFKDSGGKSGSEKEYADATERLKQLQEDQEKDTIVQMTTKDASVREAMATKIANNRIEMDQVSDNLASLSSASGYGPVHQRNAVRLRDMCAKNKGVYIKLGQHLAMLDYVLPEEYGEVLSSLLADTPTTPWEGVQRVLKQDLGDNWRDLFESIEETPMASASLAQVHVGVLREDNHYDNSDKNNSNKKKNKRKQKVAIKVQHEGLLRESHMDMRAITVIVDRLSDVFDGFSYRWLTKEMNDNLPRELDFTGEKANLLRAKHNLREFIDSGDLVIPRVHDQACTRRVLTMDYEEGVYVTDTRTIKKQWGLSTGDIASTVSRVFCEQMYRHGFVHCDPHEGNILVRPHATKKGKASVVLLDHGLYRDLGETFRMSYCRLWRSLVMGDEKGIKDTCNAMNVGPAYTLLAAMLTMRPWDDVVNQDRDKLKGNSTTKGESEMLKAYANKYFKDIVQLLGRVDSQMLLLLKTNDCLRHLDRKLGAPVNTTKIVAAVTADVLYEEERKGGVNANVKGYWNWLLLQSRVVALGVIGKWLSITSSSSSKE
jgi:aarF domain-containing kinase